MDASSAQHQPPRSVSAATSELDAEFAEIAQLMREGKYEEGSVKVSSPVCVGMAIVNSSFPVVVAIWSAGRLVRQPFYTP